MGLGSSLTPLFGKHVAVSHSIGNDDQQTSYYGNGTKEKKVPEETYEERWKHWNPAAFGATFLHPTVT